jgi:hypothetical protein
VAKLRRVGNAMSAVGGDLLSFALQRMGAREQSDLVAKRQQELAGYNDQLRRGQAEDARKQSVLDKLLSDPTGQTAQYAADAGVDMAAPFVPSADTATTRTAAGINKLTKREELPADIGLESMLGAAPGGRQAAKDPIAIEKLIQARNAKRGVFDAADKAQTAQAGEQAFQTAQQSGLGEEAADAANFPAQLGRKKTEFNTMTPLEVNRAGRVSGAQASAQNNAEIAKLTDPRYMAAKVEEVRRMGIAKAAMERSQEHAKFINDAADTIASVTPDWERLVKLSKTVNTSDRAQIGTHYITAPLQLNKDATELDQIAANMAKRLGNDPRLGGNKGAQSEKDSQAIQGRLPNSYDSAESAQRKIAAWNDNMYKGLQAVAEMPSNATPQQKINKMRESVGLPALDLANPNAGQFDPTGAESKFDMWLEGKLPPTTMRPVPTHGGK